MDKPSLTTQARGFNYTTASRIMVAAVKAYERLQLKGPQRWTAGDAGRLAGDEVAYGSIIAAVGGGQNELDSNGTIPIDPS